MEKLYTTLKKYQALNLSMSIEAEREMLYQYVYMTNKLEGNKLTLAQTSQLLSTDTISGNNIRAKDILEQKGMYKALVRMLKAVREKEPLSAPLLIELNWLAIGTLWRSDDSYLDAKQKGQTPNKFKVSNNIIEIKQGGKVIEALTPISNPDNVQENMQNLIKTITESNASIIKKAAYFAQELWLHQPFVDGNKRTGRLAINFLTMKEGFPLFIFDDNILNYNSLLVQQYYEKKPGLITNFIEESLINRMNKSLQIKPSKGKSKGFRMIL